MSFLDRWGKSIQRYVIPVLIIAILIVGGLIARQALFPPEIKTPRTAAERTLMDAEDAVRANSRNADARAELAKAYIAIGRYNDAIDQGKIGLKIDAQNAKSKYYLGLGYKEKGDFENAIKYFNDAAKTKDQLADFYVNVYYQMGEIQMAWQKYPDAIVSYDMALKNDPSGDVNIIYALGQAYEKSGRTKEAIERYKEIISFVPGESRALEALQRLKAIQ